MSDYMELMFRELREGRDQYAELRECFEKMTAEKTKIALRIRLIEKLLALEQPERRAG